MRTQAGHELECPHPFTACFTGEAEKDAYPGVKSYFFAQLNRIFYGVYEIFFRGVTCSFPFVQPGFFHGVKNFRHGGFKSEMDGSYPGGV